MQTRPNIITRLIRNILGKKKILNLPEPFVDHWFNSTSLNYVYDNEDLVGILDLSPQWLNISNIGVAPKYRRKGYGKQIMHYAMQTLKDNGTESARLRVHAENSTAIHLYESLGMTRGNSYRALVLRN